MRLGFQISIARGFSKVIEQALIRKCETIQFFSRNPRQWGNPSLPEKEVKEFKDNLKKKNIYPLFIHAPYLVNLSSSKESIYFKSVRALSEELLRAEILGVSYVIIHPGSRTNGDEKEAIKNIARGINQILNKLKNKTIILLENTAGQGKEIGYNFSQIRAIIELIKDKRRIGVCLDLAHAFEAGYDLSTKEGFSITLREFERLIGFDKLHLLHLNDSRTPLGSHSDRHEHIGKGYIGLRTFRRIVNHPLLSSLPGIMETPFQNKRDDLKNMLIMKSLSRRSLKQ